VLPREVDSDFTDSIVIAVVEQGVRDRLVDRVSDLVPWVNRRLDLDQAAVDDDIGIPTSVCHRMGERRSQSENNTIRRAASLTIMIKTAKE
jgi:hypothetical protein